MESQAIFQAKTQANLFFSIEFGPQVCQCPCDFFTAKHVLVDNGADVEASDELNTVNNYWTGKSKRKGYFVLGNKQLFEDTADKNNEIQFFRLWVSCQDWICCSEKLSQPPAPTLLHNS